MKRSFLSAYEDCKNIVKDEWAKYGEREWKNPVQHFQITAKRSLAQLKIWSKGEFKGKKEKLDELVKQLKKVKHNYTQNVDGEEIRKLEDQISNMLIDEEVYWKQRSRAD